MYKSKIFVSGGAGVIGKILVRELIKKKAKVFVGDLKDCPPEFVGKVYYRKGDLNYITPEEINNFKPEYFFHLAATFERTNETYSSYNENFHNNILLSNYLLKIFKNVASLKKIIYASSYLIYDKNLYLSRKKNLQNYLLDENDRCNPRNLVGTSKLLHEKELNFISKYKKRLKIICVRIFRGYGCGSNDVISRWIRSCINNEQIKLYRKDGRFDYIYAKDTADGILKLSKLNKKFEIVNLGFGKSRSVQEIIDILKLKFSKIKIKEVRNKIKCENSAANIKKLYKLTKWKAKYTLEKGIDEIISFEKKQKKNKYPLSKKNILITSFNSKKYPLFTKVKQAKEKVKILDKIYVANTKKDKFHKLFSNFYWKMPPSEKKFNKKIIDGCKKRNISIILPTSDLELLYWSKHKKFFKKNKIDVMVSNPSGLIKCIDKLKFYKFCKKNSFNTPTTSNSIDKVKGIRKFVIKERFSNMKGLIVLNKKSNEIKNYLKKIKVPLFQEFCRGKEITVDAWINKNNQPIKLITRYREKVEDGESKITTIFKNTRIEKIFYSLLKKLKLQGHVNVQAIIEGSKVIIIECNPRFGGASTLSIEAGLDSFFYSFQEIFNVKSNYEIPINKKLTQYRVPHDIYI